MPAQGPDSLDCASEGCHLGGFGPEMHLGQPAEPALSWTQLASAAWLRAGQLGRQLGWAECGLSCRTLAEL